MVEESKSAQSAPNAVPAPAGQQPVPGSPATAVHQQAQGAAGSPPANAETPASAETPAGVETPAPPADPGFLERGGLRRRLRFLRKTRELAYRDLGGLVFEMHRLGQERKDLLDGKLATLARIDTELRAIEDALHERRGVTVLREAGVTACPRCAAIHGSEDHFCPNCGFSMGRAERPIATNPVATPVATPAPAPTPAAKPPTATPAPAKPLTATPPAATPQPNSSPPTPATSVPRPQNAPVVPISPTPRPAPAHEVDEPTEIVEPPTRIVRPGDPPAEESRRA